MNQKTAKKPTKHQTLWMVNHIPLSGGNLLLRPFRLKQEKKPEGSLGGGEEKVIVV